MSITVTTPLTSHDRAVLERYRLAVDDGPPIGRALVLCFVNRSGSNYLGELLKSTGVVSGLREIMNDDSIEPFAGLHPDIDTLGEYVRRQAALDEPAEIWGMKASGWQILLLRRAEVIPRMLTPVYVNITRRDLLAQAVSLYVARRTGQWKDRPAADVPYDADAILAAAQSITQMEAANRFCLTLMGGPAVTLQYEDVVADPAGAVAIVGRALGYPDLRPRMDSVASRIQRTPASEAIKQRFAAEVGDLAFEWRDRRATPSAA